ncbi:hypothetical protein [Sinorhizobium sojae]|uniref:hypothetical protein n=1 Tax=Sinorhizobium sojae TaxID=716925 RepID=UPI001FCB8F7D|nr:hypothetical protein [Sinorhizobium sojae]
MNWLVVAGVATTGYGVFVGYTLGWSRTWTFLSGDTDLNAVGDFTAGMFAPVALIWLVAAVFTQRQELNETRVQFAENQKVVDKQLKTIDSQNKLLVLQHQQAFENAKQAYKLNLFDKRFEIYQKFINFDNEHNHKDYDLGSFSEMVNLSHEASFVFDRSITEWFLDIARQIDDYLTFKEQNPYEDGPDGHGNILRLNNERNVELQQAYARQKSRIRELFRPEERIERFWSYMNVTDQPLVT